MQCVSACPNDVFSRDFDVVSVLQILRTMEGQKSVVLSCSRQQRSVGQVTVPCIGFFTESLLAALHCTASKIFFFNVGSCVECENGHVLKILHERLKKIRDMVEPENEIRIRLMTGKAASRPDTGLQRRSFLQSAGKNLLHFSREASAELLPALEPEPPADGEKSPVQVSRTLQAAFEMLPEEKRPERNLLRSYFYTVAVSKNCRICPSCVGMCPTGALKRKRNGKEWQLVFVSAKCSGCGLCRAFCKKQAVTIKKGYNSNPIVADILAS
jgi:ferredoxin